MDKCKHLMSDNLNYSNQRELGAELFPEIAEFILDDSNCYLDILNKVRSNDLLKGRFVNAQELPLQWRYIWALNFGDIHAMIFKEPKVSDSYYWEGLFINYLDLEEYEDRISKESEQKILDEWNFPLRTDN